MSTAFHSATLAVREVIQGGDAFLLRYNCPACKTVNLQAYPDIYCTNCALDFAAEGFTLPSHRTQYVLLAGTRRKKKIPKAKFDFLVETQNNQCAYCDQTMFNPELEHIVPVSVGGTNNLDNLVLACRICNALAGSKCFPSFIDKKDYILDRRFKRND